MRRWTFILAVVGIFILAAPGCGLLQDAPPTVTPIYITATPLPPVVPIIATETPQATSVVAATSAALLPTQAVYTVTPVPQLIITMTPSFTPTMTDTPVTPNAAGFVPVGGIGSSGADSTTGCSNPPQGTFGAIYQSDPTLASALGCPLAASSTSISNAYQSYQNGLMIWVSSLGVQSQSAIYALFNNGTYQRYNDTFTEGVDPDSSGASPPAGLLEPVRGFGKVWRENATVRDTLGWASGSETGGTGQVLMFERGEMVSASQSGQTYILITGAPGTWTARSGY